MYSRVILKLSGEALLGQQSTFGIHHGTVRRIAEEIGKVHARGVEVAVVIGGGNIVRGMEASSHGLDRVAGDYMGMLATVINALALRDALERLDIQTRVQSAIAMQQVAEPFIPRRAIRHLEKGRVVILAAGTGNPFFTTDTTAALRAAEIGADVLLKATKVDGIYTADPLKDPSATRLHHLSYMEVLNRGLEVMDNTALTLCMDNGTPIVVFDLLAEGSIERVILGEDIGTRVDAHGERLVSDRTRSEDSQAQIQERLDDAAVRMEKSLESLHKELGGIRTGRATPSLVDRIQVDYYGTADAAAEHRRGHRARGAAAAHPAVRPQLHRRHREGAAEERARAQPEQRRPGDPHRHPAAHRGAPPRVRQDGQAAGRGGAHRGAQHPPRRGGPPAQAREGGPRLQGRDRAQHRRRAAHHRRLHRQG